MVVEPLKPKRGGFLRPFGCALFIKEFLMGHGPYGSPTIDPEIGACQSDIFYHYKFSLMRATALDRAVRTEEKRARREKRPISPDNIDKLIAKTIKLFQNGKCRGGDMTSKKHFTIEEAREIGESLGIDWSKFDVEQYRMGLDVELEHGLVDPHTNVTNDDQVMTGKIALAHLNEFPDYYTRLEKMEREAEGR